MFKSITQTVEMQSSSSGPLRQREAFAIQREQPVASGVLRILLAASPSTISRFVISIVVWVAVQLIVAGRTLAHVSKKVSEGLSPSRANRYAATAVLCVLFVFGIFASLNHCPPNHVFRGTLAVNVSTVPVVASIRRAVKIGLSHEMFLSSKGLLWLEPADVSASVRLASC